LTEEYEERALEANRMRRFDDRGRRSQPLLDRPDLLARATAALSSSASQETGLTTALV
jgi:hypothetical protein